MTDAPTPDQSLAALRQRLDTLAQNPPFRFRDTSRADAEAYLARQARVEGCTADEVAAAEAALGLQFPQMLALFYLQMGRASGRLFVGSDVARIEEVTAFTAELPRYAKTGNATLPDTAICFMMHQGYIGYYTLGTRPGTPRPLDAPVFLMLEGEAAPRDAAPSLAEYIAGEVGLMEEVHAMQLKQGGHYLTVSDGMVRETYPALASGERPLDRDDNFRD